MPSPKAPPLKELGPDPVSGAPVVVKSGRFGDYVTDGEYTLRKDDTVEAITIERAAELLAERRAKGGEVGQARREEDHQEGRQEGSGEEGSRQEVTNAPQAGGGVLSGGQPTQEVVGSPLVSQVE